MINPNFYIDNVLVSTFGRGLQHYPIKTPTTVLSTYDYEVEAGDTMYSLAKRLFGNNAEYRWTIISDINYLRRPDELVAGEVIKLPILVLDDTRFTQTDYGSTTSATSKI